MEFAAGRAGSLLLGAGSFLVSGASAALAGSGHQATVRSEEPSARPAQQQHHSQQSISIIPSSHAASASGSAAEAAAAAAATAATAATSGISSENGPILYNEPNRTSAIDDIRSVVLYIFIITIFFSFFLILPGIRNEKFPTFFCITTSLIVVSIILISLFGTSWHVAEAPISAAYKAFSRDRIQGELSVSIGLQSVNITLRAHKYYVLHDLRGPMIMYNLQVDSGPAVAPATGSGSGAQAARPSNLADELTVGRSADGTAIETELELDEVFPASGRINRRATASNNNNGTLSKRSAANSTPRGTKKRKFAMERLNVDINYNERFYFIGPEQMRQEHHRALERGLPYPILTVVEYLSQDEAGFSWSRQYRAAGYYSHMMLWLSLCVCALMFVLHCAAPKYGIYTMQLLGCLLLLTNLTYAFLVPRADRKLVIPFEGRSLAFQFGWNFWAVSAGGCLSLVVGTLIVVIDALFPNFIFTTILDVDFDSHHNFYRHRPRRSAATGGPRAITSPAERAPFERNSSSIAKTNSSRASQARLEQMFEPPANRERRPSNRRRSASPELPRSQDEQRKGEDTLDRVDHYKRLGKKGNLKSTHQRLAAAQQSNKLPLDASKPGHLSRL